MTRTITIPPGMRSGEQSAVPGLPEALVPTEPAGGAEATARRRRTRFPGPEPEAPAPGPRGRSAVRWAGSDQVLRALVRDHATAVGLELHGGAVEVGDAGGPVGIGASAVVCTVVDAASLADGRAPGRGAAPLLVVTGSPEIPAAVWSAALATGAQAVLPLPDSSDELLSRLAELARPRSSSLLVGVVGGCGGAGASSFAARVAGAARARGPVALIDADPFGGGIDLLVEAPESEGIRWRDTAALGPDDGEALRAGLPQVDEVHLLVAGEDHGPLEQDLPPVLSALSALDGTVVVDLSSAMVPIAVEHLHQLLVVVPSTDHAVRATMRRLRAWQLPDGLASAVVRRSGPLGAGEVCEDLGLDLAATFRDSPRSWVPLLDRRRRGADRAAVELMARLVPGRSA